MKATKPMITSIPISQARTKLGELTNNVFKKENIYILNKSGLPIAAIISMEDLDKLGLTRVKEFNSLVSSLGQEAEKKGITEEDLDEMMEETKDLVYKKIYGR